MKHVMGDERRVSRRRITVPAGFTGKSNIRGREAGKFLSGMTFFAKLRGMIHDSIRRTPRPQDLIGMSTQELRDTFHIAHIFSPGHIHATFTDLDRLVVGGVMPTDKPVELPNHKETGRAFFLERRELGAINIGGAGKVLADGQSFALDKLDCVYLPMGTKSVSFTSDDANAPAKFISFPVRHTRRIRRG